ncbi:MAG: nitrous oxide reductase accessory protein NosL [Nitrospirae bacterium]|nr:nitrous oxide reductase accessory protein NosL [Nitrospirota bacterium]
MKIFMILSAMCLLFMFASEGTAAAENARHCRQCEMDLGTSAHSRLLITYADGTSVEVCSIHCAVENMDANKDKQVLSLMVADYGTKDMIDAKTAVWVIGGRKEGVMTSLPKWAFAKADDARKFINGGSVAAFDDVLIKVREELSAEGQHSHEHHGHDHMHMGPGSQMIFNPAFGDDIYHTHPAGMWMVNYRFMHMNMTGLRAGTTDQDINTVGYNKGASYAYNYMMVPSDMTMDMHMMMLMYGVTDRLTVMAMPSYVDNAMNMLMDMGTNKMGMRMLSRMPTMSFSGIGDTELRGMYKISDHFVGSLGLSLPTGDINQTFTAMRTTYRAPYDMQLGSGSYDLKPALTYTCVSDDAKWSWGGQAMYTYHPARNSNDWNFGDSFKMTGWLQRAVGPATLWARLAFSDIAKINGVDRQINLLNHPLTGMGAPTPDADPANYGGQRLDTLFGTSLHSGAFDVGFEVGVPVYQRLNGLQLQTSWFVTVGVQMMF